MGATRHTLLTRLPLALLALTLTMGAKDCAGNDLGDDGGIVAVTDGGTNYLLGSWKAFFTGPDGRADSVELILESDGVSYRQDLDTGTPNLTTGHFATSVDAHGVAVLSLGTAAYCYTQPDINSLDLTVGTLTCSGGAATCVIDCKSCDAAATVCSFDYHREIVLSP